MCMRSYASSSWNRLIAFTTLVKERTHPHRKKPRHVDGAHPDLSPPTESNVLFPTDGVHDGNGGGGG